MSFDWPEYLTIAQFLSGDNSVVASEEARMRSALNRAYYAVYGTARAVARARDGYKPQTAETSHQGLINHFKKGPDRTRMTVGTNLERMRRNRIQADYNLRFEGNLSFEVRTMLGLAASVLQDLEKLRQ
jgi:uncharacterized protein (UPF0332 family)